jgi:hypothetical protein
MKSTFKIWTLITASLFLFSCGGGGSGDDQPDPTPINNAPNKSVISAPVNNLLCINNVVQFQWEAATDPDGDAVNYQLQLATNNQFTENVQNLSNIVETSYQLSLNKGVAYYWRVQTVDSKGLSSEYSNIFQFYTEGDGASNHVPFAPYIVSPNLNQIIQTTDTKLEWAASDVDNDPLTYDLYFGTANPPITKVAENQSSKTFDITLNSSTDYYWKIVVNDGKGGISFGQIWNFKTD